MKILQRFWPGPPLLERLRWSHRPLRLPLQPPPRVDRSRNHIMFKIAKGGTETLHTDNSFTAHSSRVIVHYADESGRQVARFGPAH
jgi:hypothetical protein